MGNRAGCLLGFLSLFQGGARRALPPPLPNAYRLRADFLSPAELMFYHALLLAVGENGVVICPKVNLADLLYSPTRNQGARNRIDRKHVDFLICDGMTMLPRIGIELDDSSHDRPDRQVRDALVDGAFQGAGLPLLHFAARSQYTVANIAMQLAPYLSRRPISAIATPSVVMVGVVKPRCPKCGIEMVERRAARGAQAGMPFYGCSNFPRCREIVPINNQPPR